MALRVVTGRFKGRRLNVPDDGQTRPTTQRTREAIFSMLGPETISGARILDLYCGSGSMGIEALSRGAVGATFVDSSSVAAKAVQDSLKLCGVGEEAEVKLTTVEDFLTNWEGPATDRYEVVFIDPPYELAKTLDSQLFSDRLRSLLTETAYIVFESSSNLPIPLNFPLMKERTYGDTAVKVYVTES